MRRTKILCTIGPATDSVENLARLINVGMDSARLNFSHGSHDVHLQTIKNIREAELITNKNIAIIQDLQGPKIRTSKVPDEGVLLQDGADFIITSEQLELGTALRVSTSYQNLIKEVKAGNQILLDDGYIILNVIKTDKINIYTKVVKGGILKSNKGIIAPGVSSSAPSLSDKDIEDLKFGLNAGVDAVALSFVRSERDVIELKTAMKLFGRTVPIISKIERFEGYEDIKDIIEESDAIMVARGDLGLEMPAEQVPVLQKEIIEQCNYYGRPVIIATQMLESMISNPRPTRAEASDVANAVIDGADCVMLSGETSIGKYPFEAVDYMSRIIINVEEKYLVKNKIEKAKAHSIFINDAVAKASCVLAENISAKAIVPITNTGITSINVAKYRPSQPIVSITKNVQNKFLSIIWGINYLTIPDNVNTNSFDELTSFIQDKMNLKSEDLLVFLTGSSQSDNYPEDIIKVCKV
jgi:pyruvate kinase